MCKILSGNCRIALNLGGGDGDGPCAGRVGMQITRRLGDNCGRAGVGLRGCLIDGINARDGDCEAVAAAEVGLDDGAAAGRCV